MSEVIVVTGASAGLGRAIVERFARDGCSIGLIARGRERLEQAGATVEALGGRALLLPLDVADADAVEHAAETVERELGPIDVWINNAMVSVYSPIKQMPAAEFRRVTEVTYLGYVHGTLAALKRMLPRDRGIIIQVGPEDYLIAGQGLIVNFAPLGDGPPLVGIDSAREGTFNSAGAWVPGRLLNGDQTHQGRHIRLPPDEFQIQRVRLYRYR